MSTYAYVRQSSANFATCTDPQPTDLYAPCEQADIWPVVIHRSFVSFYALHDPRVMRLPSILRYCCALPMHPVAYPHTHSKNWHRTGGVGFPCSLRRVRTHIHTHAHKRTHTHPPPHTHSPLSSFQAQCRRTHARLAHCASCERSVVFELWLSAKGMLAEIEPASASLTCERHTCMHIRYSFALTHNQ